MPLLGKHKSNSDNPNPSSGQQASNNNSAASRPQQVCQSPLFGLRRQLELSDPQLDSTKAGQSDCGELNSLPQQMSREQIHYAFSMMDTNDDGMIDLRDLSQMLANLGVPIDEAILSHLMSGIAEAKTTTEQANREQRHNQELTSRRISEQEFLDWISHFIQVSDSKSDAHEQTPRSAPAKAQRAKPASSSSSSGGSLIAHPPVELPRTRRGSGSGLALARAYGLKSAASAADAAPSNAEPVEEQKKAKSSSQAEMETRNDLKAAFCVFDLDGDGFITLDEVRAGLKLLGETWTTQELQSLFNKAAGKDLIIQRISIDDFVQLLL